MLHFAAPLGLLALGALLVPLLLHLVRRPPVTVRVGNLGFLSAARRPLRALRWHRWLLLVLRCALLAALAFAFAGVAWQPRSPSPARWLLLVPGTELDPAARTAWDQLRSEGYAPRLLALNFPTSSSATPTATFPTTTLPSGTSSTAAPSDVWSLLREADLALPAGSRAHVFGPTSAALFRGPRPALSHLAVTWHATATPPPATVPATTPPRVALVSAANRAEDARYLRAILSTVRATIVADETAAWIFQLGDAPLPPALSAAIARGAHLVTDAPDSAPTRLTARTFSSGARLHRRIDLAVGAPLHRDSTGEPWLVETPHGSGRHWQFAFRFHPEWTDWPLTGAWAEWWRAQLAPPPDATAPLSPAQASPAYTPASSTPPTPPAPPTALHRLDLRPWAWWLAVALFAAERLLSLRNTTRTVPA